MGTKLFSPLSLASLLLLASCSPAAEPMPEPAVSGSLDPAAYQEVETSLNEEDVEDSPSKAAKEERQRLEKAGTEFWRSPGEPLLTTQSMQRLKVAFECPESDKANCHTTGLKIYSKNLPAGAEIGECDGNGWCALLKPSLPLDFIKKMKDLGEFRTDGKEVYTIRGESDWPNEGEYSIFRGEEKLFSSPMFYGAEHPLQEATVVLEKPSFTFVRLKGGKAEGKNMFTTTDVFYEGKTLNEAYGLEGSSHLFAYQGKIGFVAEKDGKKFLMFNGQKASADFDQIRTHGCCAVFPYPILLDEKGIFSFLAKRGENYYLAEANLNHYLIQNP